MDPIKGKIIKTLPAIQIGSLVYDYRQARYKDDVIFVVLNAKTRKNAYIYKYDLDFKLLASKCVSYKPITSFCIGEELIGFGSSDMSITLLDLQLKVIGLN